MKKKKMDINILLKLFLIFGNSILINFVIDSIENFFVKVIILFLFLNVVTTTAFNIADQLYDMATNNDNQEDEE